MSELVDLLRHAFPRTDAGVTVCAFDGAPRKADHALCRTCWFARPAKWRKRYMDADLEERARMIVAVMDGTE